MIGLHTAYIKAFFLIFTIYFLLNWFENVFCERVMRFTPFCHMILQAYGVYDVCMCVWFRDLFVDAHTINMCTIWAWMAKRCLYKGDRPKNEMFIRPTRSTQQFNGQVNMLAAYLHKPFGIFLWQILNWFWLIRTLSYWKFSFFFFCVNPFNSITFQFVPCKCKKTYTYPSLESLEINIHNQYDDKIKKC